MLPQAHAKPIFYHTLSTDSQIIDADALRGENGNIYIHILTADGIVTDDLIQRVLANTSNEKKRPLSDLVHVAGGQPFNFELDIKVYPLTIADPNSVLATAQVKAQIYVDELKRKLGRDIVPSQIIDRLSGDGIWQIEVVSPSQPVILEPYQWANCTQLNISLGGSQNG